MRTLRTALAAALLVLATGCSAVGDNTLELTAELSDSAGLFEGNDVGILGHAVGTITAIEPAGDHVRVEMEIDGEYDVPADAGAVVVARSVATDRYLELTPVYSGEGPTLSDGDVIALERTRTPVDFDQVLASINTFATGIAGSGEATRAIERFLDAGADALDGRGDLLNESITSLGDAVDGVAGQREEVVAAVRSLDRLVANIAEHEQTTRRFIQQVSEGTTILAEERGNFRRALRALDRAVTVVAQFAVDNRAEIVRGLDGTTAIMRQLMSREDRIAEILEVMPLALENLTRVDRDGRLSVRIDPLILVPLTEQLGRICEALPLDLCANLGTDPPLLDELLGGLG